MIDEIIKKSNEEVWLSVYINDKDKTGVYDQQYRLHSSMCSFVEFYVPNDLSIPFHVFWNDSRTTNSCPVTANSGHLATFWSPKTPIWHLFSVWSQFCQQ